MFECLLFVLLLKLITLICLYVHFSGTVGKKNLIYNVLVYFNITQLIPQDYVITFITDKSLMFCDGCDFILSLLILILSKYFAEKGHYSISQILHINYVVII